MALVVKRPRRRGQTTNPPTSERKSPEPDRTPLGIFRPQISAPRSTQVMATRKPLPSDEVLNILFDKLLFQLQLPPDKVAEMNMMSPQQKWSLILAQQESNSGLSCVYYIEQLVRHAQPALKEKKVKRKLLDKLHPLGKVLKDLEVELRTGQESWVNEFVTTPNHGHIALIDLLKDLIYHPSLLNVKLPAKFSVLQRSPAHVHVSLMCVRALMNQRSGFSSIISYKPSILTLVECLAFPHNKTKILVLKLLISVLLAPGGPSKVYQGFEQFKQLKGEQKKYQLLVYSLLKEPIDHVYQAEALRFINTVVQTAGDPNSRVYHQQEFLNAGLDVTEIMHTLRGDEDERILHEIREWSKHFTDVQQIIDNLMITRGRARGLKQELDMTLTSLRETTIQRDKYVEYGHKLKSKCIEYREELKNLLEEMADNEKFDEEKQEMQKQLKLLKEINKRYKEHTIELRTKVLKVVGEKELEGIEIDQNLDFSDMIEQLEKQSSVSIATQTSESMTKLHVEEITDGQDQSQVPEAPPPPPMPGEVPPAPPLPGDIPAPPPLPGAGQTLKKAYFPSLPLPTINWVPLRTTQHTIFEEMNDEGIIETVDFSEFETLFQVRRLKTKDGKLKSEKPAKPKHLELLDTRRARAVVFAKRRIKYEPQLISKYVNNTDLDGLIPEHCELLIQIVPQEKEMEELAKNANRFKEFGEAELYLYQLAKIARLEERLTAMFFMGTFDELLNQTQPRVDAVLNASLSIFRSSRLKNVFEVILAFGNYMNSSKRGSVNGYKLESLGRLTDTRSNDKKQTLLNYICNVVEKIFPHLLSFHEELKIDEACEVSMETVDADVEAIKQGLKSLLEEQESEPQNFILYSFSKQAKQKVDHLMETYEKMKSAYTEVCLMFSESSTSEPAEFFTFFKTFIKAWKSAVVENQNRKGHKMVPAEILLKKQTQKEMFKDLAIEAASVATSRSEQIQKETLKLQEKMKEEEKEEEETVETKPLFEMQQVKLKPVDKQDRMNKDERKSTVSHEKELKQIDRKQQQLIPSHVQNGISSTATHSPRTKRKGPISAGSGLLDDEYYSSLLLDEQIN